MTANIDSMHEHFHVFSVTKKFPANLLQSQEPVL